MKLSREFFKKLPIVTTDRIPLITGVVGNLLAAPLNTPDN